MKKGAINLPLHGGKAPSWLFEKMVRLSRQITLAIIEEFSPAIFLKKISDPLWFQSFGCVLGFDWHSSGLTTTVCAALKEGLRGLEKNSGIIVAGGKGKTSRKTPEEILNFGWRFSFDPMPLIYASKMSAKVDNTAIQDGYNLYHHTFLSLVDGNSWAVIQQGMNITLHKARRYHWLSDKKLNFTQEPHAGIITSYITKPLNLVDKKSLEAQEVITFLSNQNPEKTIFQFGKIIDMPQRHPIILSDIKKENLRRILIQTYRHRSKKFEELLGIKGVGLKTIRALSLISELIYGVKPSYEDPAKFSFAHGGKDGYPYPVQKRTYENSISVLEMAIKRAKIGQREKIEAIKKLRFLN